MPGARIIVQFHGLNALATADSTGAWKALLPSLPASNVPADLVIRGENTVTLHDLVVGEVWLCSGESNWECRIWDSKRAIFRVLNGKTEVAAANHPLIRQFAVVRPAASPLQTPRGNWEVCVPTTVLHFSAVGYFFAREIYRQLSIPVGIIDSSQAGTPLQLQISCEAGGTIQPLIPYALRGMLWDPGAAGATVVGAKESSKLFAALITSWRASLGQGDVPFYWVQRASFGQDPEWLVLRGTQQTLKLPNTGRALAIDLRPEDNGRPRNEQEVGRRLALIAAHRIYGLPVECSGPTFAGFQVEGTALRVKFDFVGSGLKASQPVATCELAGADRKFYPATAEIDGKTLVVRSAQVPQPVAVRYGWTGSAEGHLYNSAGLPAAPFQSDDAEPDQPDRVAEASKAFVVCPWSGSETLEAFRYPIHRSSLQGFRSRSAVGPKTLGTFCYSIQSDGVPSFRVPTPLRRWNFSRRPGIFHLWSFCLSTPPPVRKSALTGPSPPPRLKLPLAGPTGRIKRGGPCPSLGVFGR